MSNSFCHDVPDAAVLAGWLSEMMAAGAEQHADVLTHLRLATHWLRSCATSGACEPSQLAGLLRIIRGAPASGQHAVATVLEAGAPAALASLAPHLMVPSPQSPSATSTAPSAGVALPTTPHGQPGSDVLLLTILSQALGNLAMSGLEGAYHVWSSCYPAVFSLLLSHPHAKVWEPCAMALYACCRVDAARSRQLCVEPSQDTVAPLWALMLSRAVVKESPASAPSKHGDTVCSQWVQLLVGCVAFKHGLLHELLACLPSQEAVLHSTQSVHSSSTNNASNSTSSKPEQDALSHSTHSVPSTSTNSSHSTHSSNASASYSALALPKEEPERNSAHHHHHQQQQQLKLSWCHLTPVLLHILAHELEAMVVNSAPHCVSQGESDRGEGSKKSTSEGAQHNDSQCTSANGGATLRCASEGAPWQRALRCLMGVVRGAASQSRHGCGPSGACSGTLPDGAPMLPLQSEGVSAADQAQLARHVLEAGLEVLKCLALREDCGTGICGGADPVVFLCDQEGLLLHLLGMLYTLQPIQNPGRKASSASASQSQNQNTPSAALGQQQQQQGHTQPQQQPQQTQQQQGSSAKRPLYTQPPYTHHAPIVPPYQGYRGDVLAVIANAMSARPTVAEALAQQEGAVELVLAQCQLDDESPLAREWGLWAVRNLCAGSSTAQQRIKQLEPVAPVDSPELRALGMRLEMDHQTGKLKVVKTNEPPHF